MNAEFISAVKIAMGLTDTAPMEVETHIRAAAAYMVGGGVPEADFTVDNHLAVNCAAIGANDIFQTESGKLVFSDTFHMMIAQMRA